MQIEIIQHESYEAPGEYLLWAKRNHHEVEIIKLYQGDTLPKDVTSDFLLVLGGPQSPSTTKEECPYFDSEKEISLIQKYEKEKKIVIGVCLGAQLMGEAFGGRFEHSPYKEVGLTKMELTKEGREDINFSSFPSTFLSGSWHSDMPGLAKDSVVLAKSDGCPREIIRYGEYAYGFQCHLEFNPLVVKGLIQSNPSDLIQNKENPYISSPEEMLRFSYASMNGYLDSFLDSITKRYQSLKLRNN